MATTPDLQDAIATVINRSLAGLDTATSFVKGQLPDIISQLLTWTIALNITTMVLWLILLLITILYSRRLKKRGIQVIGKNSPTVGGVILVLLSFVTLCVLSLAVIPAIIETVKVIFAPKLFLIDYVKDLTTTTNGR